MLDVQLSLVHLGVDDNGTPLNIFTTPFSREQLSQDVGSLTA
jgi:hypothetical protein